MTAQLYGLLAGLGYHHPLHPALTHLPVGLTIGSFIFMVLAFVLRRPKYAQTAKHCAILALLAAIPTAVLGYLDWQHFYGGAFLFPIKMKFVLAALLIVLLCTAAVKSMRSENGVRSRLMIHLAALLVVAGLGYFGGELVYGKKSAPQAQDQTRDQDAATAESVLAGAKLFEQNCSFCHFIDSADTKVGPGLKGLFALEKMPVSGWTVSKENIEQQLKTPFDEMPAFDQLTRAEIDELAAYLKSL